MKRHVASVFEDDSVRDAARIMRERDIGIVPVCDARRRVVGVATDRDFALRVCAEGRNAATTRVREVMTAGVVACRPGHGVGRAEGLMRAHRISRVFVTDAAGILLGVVSLSDVAQYERPSRLARTVGAITERKYRAESP